MGGDDPIRRASRNRKTERDRRIAELEHQVEELQAMIVELKNPDPSPRLSP